MLQTFFIYQLKVFICAALLMTYYGLVLRNKRFHYYNRFLPLLTLLFSITVLLNPAMVHFLKAVTIRLLNCSM